MFRRFNKTGGTVYSNYYNDSENPELTPDCTLRFTARDGMSDFALTWLLLPSLLVETEVE